MELYNYLIINTKSLQPKSLQPNSLYPKSLQPKSLQPKSLQPIQVIRIFQLQNRCPCRHVRLDLPVSIVLDSVLPV